MELEAAMCRLSELGTKHDTGPREPVPSPSESGKKAGPTELFWVQHRGAFRPLLSETDHIQVGVGAAS